MNFKTSTPPLIATFVSILFLLISVSTRAATVDLAESHFKWTGYKKIGKTHHGMIKLKSAKVKMKGNQILMASFVMDMNSFTVDDLQGKWAMKFLGHVKSGDFFEVEKYPEATLTFKKQKLDGTIKGQLEIKKKLQDVELSYQKKGNIYHGTLTFNRTKYGITYGSENFFKKLVADKIIKDEVTLDFHVVINN